MPAKDRSVSVPNPRREMCYLHWYKWLYYINLDASRTSAHVWNPSRRNLLLLGCHITTKLLTDLQQDFSPKSLWCAAVAAGHCAVKAAPLTATSANAGYLLWCWHSASRSNVKESQFICDSTEKIAASNTATITFNCISKIQNHPSLDCNPSSPAAMSEII